MEAIQTAASEALLSLALGVVSLLGAYGMYFIHKAAAKVRAQTQQIRDDAQRALFESALSDCERLALVTVGAIEQTTAKSLREAAKTDPSKREELVALSRKAFDEIKAAITPEAQQTITKNLGSFDAYVQKLIEEKVIELKALTGQ